MSACKDLAKLEVIWRSELPLGWVAAGRHVAKLEPVLAVGLCRKLPIGSTIWCCAFQALEVHPKRVITDYVLETGQSANPKAKYVAYRLATNMRMPELRVCAILDLDNDDLIIFGNQPSDQSCVRLVARKYLSTIHVGPKK